MAKRKHRPTERQTNQQVKQAVKKKRLIALMAVIPLVLVAVFLLVFFYPEKKELPSYAAQLLAFKPQGELQFISSNGDTLSTIAIEIADDSTSRRVGLMFRKELTEDQGMLFIFPKEEILSFWMRNTKLPLDILFVNGALDIVTIHENTTPFKEYPLFSDDPAVYVVEVKAGFADEYGIKVRDRIVWKRNEDAP